MKKIILSIAWLALAAFAQEQPKEDKPENKSEWYLSAEYFFDDGLGFGIGFGRIAESGFLIGFEFIEAALLSPWKKPDVPEGSELSYWLWGVGLNLGGAYRSLPNNFQLIGGVYANFRLLNNILSICQSQYKCTDYNNDKESVIFGPFAKIRWHFLQAGIRVFLEDDADWQIGAGFMF